MGGNRNDASREKSNETKDAMQRGVIYYWKNNTQVKGEKKKVNILESNASADAVVNRNRNRNRNSSNKKEMNEVRYKSIYEVSQYVEAEFFNVESVPWISSFFHFKEEDNDIFGNELKKRNIFKRCFQRIHKNRRRRCMSFNPYRVPLICKKVTLDEMLISEPKIKKKKKKMKKRKNIKLIPHGYIYKQFLMRAKKKNWLETHMYHCKRFRMIDIYGYKLALKNYCKISRRIFRYSKRKSLIHDMSYVEIIEIKGYEKDIINLLKKCTNAEQANMFTKKYLLGLLLGKLFIYKCNNTHVHTDEENISGTYSISRECYSNIGQTNGNNFFSTGNTLICPAYFLWRSRLKPGMYFKEKRKKNSNYSSSTDKIGALEGTADNDKECAKEENQVAEKENREGEETVRDIWIFVHPVCLKEVINNFKKVNPGIDVKHVKNICMYEMIGPRSFDLLVNILSVKTKYVMREKDSIYHYNYENVTLPYDFVIPLYAVLPKSIGPFLSHYKVNEMMSHNLKRGGQGDNTHGCRGGGGEDKDGGDSNTDSFPWSEIIKQDKCNVTDSTGGERQNGHDENRCNNHQGDSECKGKESVQRRKNADEYVGRRGTTEQVETSFDYLKEKNGNRKMQVKDFSPYDNNILMNEKIKQRIIKRFKVNRYEHIRSSKKKKVKTCILKMLENNKNIESYEVIKAKRKLRTLLSRASTAHGGNCIGGISAVDNISLGGAINTGPLHGVPLGSCSLFQTEEKKVETGAKGSVGAGVPLVSTGSPNEMQSKEKKKKKTLNRRLHNELIKTKENITLNCKKYIKIPILIINQTNNNNKRYLILCPAKKKSSVLFNLLTRNGSIAIGLKEREKILKCSEYLCYPKDFPESFGGILYNSMREDFSKKLYLKKPIKKRVNYYCLGIHNPFNYSWFCIYPYERNIKLIRATDSYNQFLIKTFLQRFLSISLNRINPINNLEQFNIFMEEFKEKFSVFSTYFISVYVHAYKEGTPKRLSHICCMTLKQLLKFFAAHVDTKKIQEWVVHKRVVKKNGKKEKIEKLTESIIHKYKNRIMKKKNKEKDEKKVQTFVLTKKEDSTSKSVEKEMEEIILPSKKIIGYVSSGGHVLSKGYGYGVAHISFYYFLQNLLHHLFALKLALPGQIKINNQGKEFPFLALMRNVNSTLYYHVWLSLVAEDKYLPF
ncbi:ribonucleases P/MRP protein subunit POP1, putative [Plasmodium ovale]|uniref:Ribonucleases P/MRP protein subunit POP1, putative n=1 Tax=Plasmodium ovale TaxID=36330 RepID=A0A1D3KZ17_PLAOA|nr:ribonucleases P/MRP protein subunit POP1, putative [Plasmodium ovale]